MFSYSCEMIRDPSSLLPIGSGTLTGEEMVLLFSSKGEEVGDDSMQKSDTRR